MAARDRGREGNEANTTSLEHEATQIHTGEVVEARTTRRNEADAVILKHGEANFCLASATAFVSYSVTFEATT
jgi:hypothetical protein